MSPAPGRATASAAAPATTNCSNGGNDLLDGGSGADSMRGGTGHDTYVVDNAGDTVTELVGEGTDTVRSFIDYMLGANVEILTLIGTGNINGTGNGLANVINGNAGNNILDGGGGADNMFGGLGDDTYIVSDLGDKATETSSIGGNDHVMSAISFQLGANIEQLTLTGSANVHGFGNALDNIITGNDGINILGGGLGADILTGGGGNDIFLYHNVAESTAAATDRILDFTSGDKIDLRTIDARTNSAGNDAFTFVGGNAFSGTAGELRAIDNGGNSWTIQADTNGDGIADLVIALTTSDPAYIVTGGDFLP